MVAVEYIMEVIGVEFYIEEGDQWDTVVIVTHYKDEDGVIRRDEADFDDSDYIRGYSDLARAIKLKIAAARRWDAGAAGACGLEISGDTLYGNGWEIPRSLVDEFVEALDALDI